MVLFAVSRTLLCTVVSCGTVVGLAPRRCQARSDRYRIGTLGFPGKFEPVKGHAGTAIEMVSLRQCNSSLTRLADARQAIMTVKMLIRSRTSGSSWTLGSQTAGTVTRRHCNIERTASRCAVVSI